MKDNNIIKMTCSVEKVIFYNEDGWGIVSVSPDKIKEGKPCLDKFGYITLKGTMPKLKTSDIINVVAEYVEDPKWGKQYNVISLYYALTFDDNDKKGQKKFLLSIFTPLQVKNMYKALEDPFTALKNKDVKSIIKIKNCGMKTADHWISKFEKNYRIIKIYTELEEYNLTNNMIDRLMNRYSTPELVIEKVKNNPYILCTEVRGIGWATADKIALDGGMEEYDLRRVGSYILYYLEQCGKEGMSWITPDELLGAIIQQLGEEIPDQIISEAIQSLKDKLWWNDEKNKIGLAKYYSIEKKIAKELIRIQTAKSNIVYPDNWEEIIKKLEEKQGWSFTPEQKEGIEKSLKNNITLIQGLAGTGKSTLVSALLEILYKYTYVQTSLSGRAASRMSEITGREGFTIHRLLGYPKGEIEKQNFVFHDKHFLPHDIFILDEISMVNADLFYYLLRAIPSGSKLICLGDYGQLESIGSGNIAFDMNKSDIIPSVILTQIHRQAEKSAIITESLKVRKGEQIIPKDWTGHEIRGELKDLELIVYSVHSNTYYEVMKAVAESMSKKDFDIMDTQIIVPVKNKGAACTYALNNAIQELYNPKKDKYQYEATINSYGNIYVLREGDKVINVQNNYNLEPAIYNGNIGVIQFFEEDKEEEETYMVIDFYGIGRVKLPKKNWKSIELGYAITVHKYQGSQAKNIIFAFDFSSYALLTRELIYTGMTRASEKLKIICQTGALRYAISQESVSQKQTHLQQCLYDLIHPKYVF